MDDLQTKVERSIKLLRLAGAAATEKGDGIVEICYSGGKDSDVILRLSQLADIKHIPIYKMTTVDPAGTIQHAREVGAMVIRPKKTFFEVIEDEGFPTKFARKCCSFMKEYKVKDVAVQGIRRCESRSRSERYKEPTVCRIYGSKENHVSVFLPILEWTDEDVRKFVEQEGIHCHPLYYDENGQFHPERRLGCFACPLKSRRQQIADFKEKPKFVRAWIKAGMVWWNKPHSSAWKSGEKFGNIYNLFFSNVFCDNYEEYLYKTTGIFGRLDTKAWLEDYFHVDLP